MTRTSLYSQNAPGSCRSRWVPFLPADGTAADAAVAVDQIGLVPQLALPFRGLLQQVVPGDRVVVRRLEAAVVVIDIGVRRTGSCTSRIRPRSTGQTGEDRQIALGDAEGQVDLRGVAPLGDDHAAAQHQPVRAAARPHRPERLVPRRRLAEIGRDHVREVAAPRRLVLGGEARGGGDGGGIETGGVGRGSAPSRDGAAGNTASAGLLRGCGLDFRRIGTTCKDEPRATAEVSGTACNSPRRSARPLLK